jgi:aspartate-semialdehyde dehydrogenase
MSPATRKICLIDPLTLLGRELLRLLAEHPNLANEIQYTHTDPDDEQQIAELDGSPALVPPLLSVDELAGCGVIIVCSDQDSPRFDHLEQLLDTSPDTVLVDTSRLERFWDLTRPAVGGLVAAESPARLRVAHPALIATHCLLDGLRPFDPTGITVAGVEPVSTHGRQAIEMLAQQAVQRIQGQEVSERIGDQVLAFNLVVGLGDRLTEEAAQVLECPLVAFSLVRSGCFHGHIAQIGVHLKGPVSEVELLDAWEADPRISLNEAPLGLDSVIDCEQVVVTSPSISPDRHTISVTAMVDGLLIGGALTALEIAQGAM